MDTPASPTEPEPQKPLPPKVGWIVGEDMEHSLLFGGIGILSFFAGAWFDRNPVFALFILLAMLGGILFSLSGTRSEKGPRRLVCIILLMGWIGFFFWIAFRML